MSTIEELKYRLMGEVNSINDEEYLEALLRLLGSASPSTKKVPLSKEEVSMIEEGLAAYDRGEFLTNEEVEKMDEEWLNRQTVTGMKMKKHQLVSVMNDLSEEFSIDELVERLLVVQKIDEGVAALEEGRTYGHGEVVDIFKNTGRGKSTTRFTESQKRMLEEAEQDVLHGRVISIEEMNKRDLQWLNGQ